MADAVLEVGLCGNHVGHLRRVAGRMAFEYTQPWQQHHGPVPLSHRLPVGSDTYGHEPCVAFFGNLLPEGAVRDVVARRIGTDGANDWRLLVELGGDCAGAVTLWDAAEQPPWERARDIAWYSPDELAVVIMGLEERPFLVDDGDIRLSLAGAQDKIPLVWDGERAGAPVGDQPTTHIFKPSIRRFPHTVLNELACLSLAGHVGLDVARAARNDIGGEGVLVVERYDRAREGERVVRVHQEDMCQALGIPASDKYQADGGPGVEDLFTVIRSVARVPAREVAALLDQLVFSYLVGNHDAHGKNFSILYAASGFRLAPMYDVLSTVPYGIDRKLAMKVGGEYRPRFVRGRHWDRLAESGGLQPRLARRRAGELCDRVLGAARDVFDGLARDDAERSFLASIHAVIDARAALLRTALQE